MKPVIGEHADAPDLDVLRPLALPVSADLCSSPRMPCASRRMSSIAFLPSPVPTSSSAASRPFLSCSASVVSISFSFLPMSESSRPVRSFICVVPLDFTSSRSRENDASSLGTAARYGSR